MLAVADTSPSAYIVPGAFMIWKSFWHIESTAFLAAIAVGLIAITLTSVGFHFVDSLAAREFLGVCAFLVIYRARYKRIW
jgi:uncharacterized membrane protein